MRRVLVVILLAAMTACGSGQSPVVDGAAGPSNTSTSSIATGDTLAPDTGAGPGTTAAVDTGAAGGDGGSGAGGGEADDGEPNGSGDGGTGGGTATSAVSPPAPGRYAFHTTGSARQGLETHPIDNQSTTDITVLASDTIRQVSASPEGTQTADLRYEAGRVALLLLELDMQGTRLSFASSEGVQFAPVPVTAGQTWSWQLVDSGGTLTLTFDGATAPNETISVAGASVEANVIDATIRVDGTYSGVAVAATIQLRTWVDPARRTAVRMHQVSNVTQPAFFASSSDTTSEFVGFTPA